MSLSRSPRSRRKAYEKARAKLNEPGRAEWKTPPPNGPCEACGRRGPRLRHHVVREQDVRREGGDPWDQRNAMLVGRWCPCHERHHWPSGNGKLPLARVPEEAVAFAVRLLGEDRARTYLARHYAA